MRAVLLCLGLLCGSSASPFAGVGGLPVQSAGMAVGGQEATGALQAALVGRWTGVLEYRDYSEPAGSNKRVQLPTWLTVEREGAGLRLRYVYDDGPAKVVTSQSLVVLDVARGTYTETGSDGKAQRYAMTGGEGLREGRGTFVLVGAGVDAGKPAEVRTTWAVGRNLLTWVEEVRAAGSGEAFVFRHRYTLTRAEAPASEGAKPR